MVCSCSDSNKPEYSIEQHCDFDVDQFILDRLNENRIVMIGDFGHRLYLYKRTVTDFLNHWLDCAENGGSNTPKRLFLVLEMDSLYANQIEESLSGRYSEYLLDDRRLFTDVYTTSTIRFYHQDLKRIFDRIERFNCREEVDSVFLDLVGPEQLIDFDRWSNAKSASFFIRGRDEYSSSRIIELLQGNSDYKALVFYGGSHLRKSRWLKQADDLSDSGVYMGHYLADRFAKDGGIYTFYQGSIQRPDIQSHRSMTSPGRTYAIDNRYLDINIRSGNVTTEYPISTYDGSIIHSDRPVRGKPVYRVWSKSVIDYTLRGLEDCEDSDNDYAKLFCFKAERYLRTFSGKKYEIGGDDPGWKPYTSQDWREWRSSTELDVVEDIQSLSLWRRLVDRMSNAHGVYVNWYEGLLSESLEIPRFWDTLRTSSERAEAYWEYVVQDRDFLVVDNLVHLLWIGDQDEKEKALQVLKTTTGQDFQTAEEWTEWWSRKQGGI